jgi:hypothetical protein
VPFGTGQRMQPFMNGGMDEYCLHDFNILEIRAYVVAFTPNCSGKIKENLNRAVYRCHLQLYTTDRF